MEEAFSFSKKCEHSPYTHTCFKCQMLLCKSCFNSGHAAHWSEIGDFSASAIVPKAAAAATNFSEELSRLVPNPKEALALLTEALQELQTTDPRRWLMRNLGRDVIPEEPVREERKVPMEEKKPAPVLATGPRKQCTICGEVYDIEKIIAMVECEHYMCRKCFEEYPAGLAKTIDTSCSRLTSASASTAASVLSAKSRYGSRPSRNIVRYPSWPHSKPHLFPNPHLSPSRRAGRHTRSL